MLQLMPKTVLGNVPIIKACLCNTPEVKIHKDRFVYSINLKNNCHKISNVDRVVHLSNSSKFYLPDLSMMAIIFRARERLHIKKKTGKKYNITLYWQCLFQDFYDSRNNKFIWNLPSLKKSWPVKFAWWLFHKFINEFNA